MKPYLALPLLAAVIAAACAAAIAALSPRERANQTGALLMGSVAWWASCEVLWRQAADASSALAWSRIAAPAFLFLGAHAVWFLSELRERELPRLARLVPPLYVVNAVFLGLTWSGDLVLAGMKSTPRGWIPVPGPLLALWFAQAALAVCFALFEWVRAIRGSGEAADAARATCFGVGSVLVIAVAGVSNVLFASLGFDVPRVATFAVATLGVAVVAALTLLGLSPLNAAGLAQHVLGLLPDGVVLVRASGRIRAVNPSVRELLRCGDEVVAGRYLAEHLDLPVLDAGVEYRAHECELVQETGLRLPVSVSTARVRTAAGDPDVLVILRDVSEVTALRKRLDTSERLAVVGRLAGGIAHEINNPLAFVRSNLHHLQRESAALVEETSQAPGAEGAKDRIADIAEVIGESIEGIDRAMRVVRDVSAFSHAGSDEHRPVDLYELIDQAFGIATLGLSPGVRVRRPSLRPGEIEVNGSPGRLKQLFLNLLINAVRAVGDDGAVKVEAVREAQRVIVSVIDDGCGIPPETLRRIFDPFFTTWPLGTGPGLGLAVCHEIVRSHGGSIEVTSAPKRGTRVEVVLPVRAPEA